MRDTTTPISDKRTETLEQLRQVFVQHAINNRGVLTSARRAQAVSEAIYDLFIHWLEAKADAAAISHLTTQFAQQGMAITTCSALLRTLLHSHQNQHNSGLEYKKSFLIILFMTNTINFLSSQCANGYVQVGSAIGISRLTEAINGGHLQVNSGGSIVGNICINGDFTIDLGYPWQNCNLLFMNGSKLLKNGPSGNSFNNCTFDGVGYTEIKLSGTGSRSVSYFLFRNCQISNITKMLCEHNGAYTFDVGCTISDVGIIQAKNDGFVAFAGSSIINSPIKIENSLFGDFCQNYFVAAGGNSSYSVLLENQSAFIGRKGSTYSNSGNSSIICNNCSPSSIENANFINSYRGVLIENSPFGFDINGSNFGKLWYGIKASNSHNITIKNCESTNSLVNFFGPNLSSHQHTINNTLADFDRIVFPSSFLTYVAMNPKIGSIDSRFGELSDITSNELSINNYKNALIWYLEYCRDLNCTEYRKDEIKNLAETCNDQNSPDQIIAKELCKILKINYSSQNCLAERNSLIKHEFEPSVYPNPTTGLLNFNNALSKDVEITNLNGQLIYKEDNIKSEFIDLSLSTNGYLHSKNFRN